jgi:hypothetical protein
VAAERRLAGLVVVLAISLALCIWPAASPAQSSPPSTFFGVSPQSPLTSADYQRMASGRIGTVRVFVDWASIDRGSGGSYDWSSLDQTVSEAAAHGVSVVPFVFGTPEWVARQLDFRNCRPPACSVFAPVGQAALAEWQRFLTAAVARYGPEGDFFAANPYQPYQPITVWQLWNEQNSATFFKPKPDIDSYATLVKTGAEAVHSVDPAARILLGGMFGNPGGVKQPKLFAWNYLRKLYRVPGIGNQFDGIAVHPYAARMAKVIEQVKLMYKATVQAHDRTEMWITEIGWSSGTGNNPLERGKRGQADRLQDAFGWFLSHRTRYRIQNVTWFAWRDLAGKPICQWCGNAGLFTASTLKPKPAWNALMTFTGGR